MLTISGSRVFNSKPIFERIPSEESPKEIKT